MKDSDPVAVYVTCRTGTRRFVGGANPYWEDEYHKIRWADMTFEEYMLFKVEQMATNFREVQNVSFQELRCA